MVNNTFNMSLKFTAAGLKKKMQTTTPLWIHWSVWSVNSLLTVMKGIRFINLCSIKIFCQNAKWCWWYFCLIPLKKTLLHSLGYQLQNCQLKGMNTICKKKLMLILYPYLWQNWWNGWSNVLTKNKKPFNKIVFKYDNLN